MAAPQLVSLFAECFYICLFKLQIWFNYSWMLQMDPWQMLALGTTIHPSAAASREKGRL